MGSLVPGDRGLRLRLWHGGGQGFGALVEWWLENLQAIMVKYKFYFFMKKFLGSLKIIYEYRF